MLAGLDPPSLHKARESLVSEAVRGRIYSSTRRVGDANGMNGSLRQKVHGQVVGQQVVDRIEGMGSIYKRRWVAVVGRSKSNVRAFTIPVVAAMVMWGVQVAGEPQLFISSSSTILHTEKNSECPNVTTLYCP